MTPLLLSVGLVVSPSLATTQQPVPDHPRSHEAARPDPVEALRYE